MHLKLHNIIFQVVLNSFVFVFVLEARTSEMKLTVTYTKMIYGLLHSHIFEKLHISILGISNFDSISFIIILLFKRFISYNLHSTNIELTCNKEMHIYAPLIKTIVLL